MSTVKEKQCGFEVVILGQYCKGCRLCVNVCETGAVEIGNSPNDRGILPACIVSQELCSGCLRCATICPEAAIEIYRLERAGQDAAGEKERK